MVAFSLETVLLMAAAYFIGAVLACVIRRSLFASRYQPVERRVDPLPEVLAGHAEGARFAGPTAASPPLPAARPAVAPPAAATGPQDLKRIHLIDAGLEAALNKQGVTRYEQIAGWMRDDVKKVSQALGLKGRINQENWIEQASILSKGAETRYSARRARGEAATAAPTPDRSGGGGEALPRSMSQTGVAAAVVAPKPPASSSIPPTSPPMVAERAAFARPPAQMPGRPSPEERTPHMAPAVPVRPATAQAADNLKRISAITPEIERGLNAKGVSRYQQIAQWSPSDVEHFEKQLQAGGRIARENWIEQAQILSRGGDTRFSRQFDAQAGSASSPVQSSVRPDLRSLRSVRSPIYQGAAEPGPEAAQRAAAQNKVVRAAGPDDLKRIRGIGVLIEKKLNSLGVTTYDHIANWTADDIDRVSQSLDFKGRIERENWIEQARILSAGGQTEFSRRVDRGEVETSRART